MRLNATIALAGLSSPETEVDEVIERIRILLHKIDPNADVGVELLGVGTDFGAPIEFNLPLANLIESANQRRDTLLHAFWLLRQQPLLHLSLRIAHAIATMDAAKIYCVLEEADCVIDALTES